MCTYLVKWSVRASNKRKGKTKFNSIFGSFHSTTQNNHIGLAHKARATGMCGTHYVRSYVRRTNWSLLSPIARGNSRCCGRQRMCAMLPFATVIEIDNFILRYNAFILRKFFFSFLFHFILFIFFISSYRKKKTEINPNKYMCFPLVLSISRQTTFFFAANALLSKQKKKHEHQNVAHFSLRLIFFPHFAISFVWVSIAFSVVVVVCGGFYAIGDYSVSGKRYIARSFCACVWCATKLAQAGANKIK